MPDPERDAGLQPERTRLAWRRTTLTCTVAATLGARASLRHGGTPAGLLALAAILLTWLAFLALAHFRITTLAVARPRTLRRREALAAVGCALALAAFALTIVN
ncbi:DUF202 domain-containing protein [Streptomyces sp. E11-3]